LGAGSGNSVAKSSPVREIFRAGVLLLSVVEVASETGAGKKSVEIARRALKIYLAVNRGG